MSTQKLARELGLTGRQLYYLIDQGVIDPAPVESGQSRTFTDHERWILQMAAAMRKAGIGISAIKDAANEHREKPMDDASLVVRGGDETGPLWAVYWDRKAWRATKSTSEALKLIFEAGFNSSSSDDKLNPKKVMDMVLSQSRLKWMTKKPK